MEEVKQAFDGYHPAWNEEILFDISADPRETTDLADQAPAVLADGRDTLLSWTDDQITRSYSPVDPLEIVLEEGGPFHSTGQSEIPTELIESLGVED